MSKTLTEQYKFGEIKTGYYWCKIWGEDSLVIKWLVEDNEIHQSNLIEEVLAPVTDYDKVKEMSQKIERLEFDNEALEMVNNEGKEINAELLNKNEQLEKKLKIAKKALKDIQVRSQRDWDEYNCMSRATRALYDIEMEGVK